MFKFFLYKNFSGRNDLKSASVRLVNWFAGGYLDSLCCSKSSICLLHLKELLALSALFNLVCLQEADDDGDDIDDDDADEFIPFLDSLIRSC